MVSFFVTTWGWFAWLAFLDNVYAAGPDGPYNIRHTFTKHFGRDAVWWSTLFVVLAILGLLELVGKAVKRNMTVWGLWHWPPWRTRRLSDNVEEWDLGIWQELEQEPQMRERLRKLANDEEVEDDLDEQDVFDLERRMDA